MRVIEIPITAVPIVRSALLYELGLQAVLIGDAAVGAVDQDDHDLRDLHESLEHFDRYRAALQAVGSSASSGPAPMAIDGERHRWALCNALQARLALERGCAAAAASPNGFSVRSSHMRNIELIEELLRSSGLGRP